MPGLDEVIVYDTVKEFVFESDRHIFSPRLIEYPVILRSLSDATLEVEVKDFLEFRIHFESVACNGRVRIISKK